MASTQNQTLSIATHLSKYIINQFQNQLKVNKLITHLAEFNAHNIDKLNKECVAYFYLQGQSNRQYTPIQEDSMPKIAEMQNIIQFHVNKIESNIENFDDKSKIFERRIENTSQIGSLNYSRSKSQQYHSNKINNTNIDNYEEQDSKMNIKQFKHDEQEIEQKSSSLLNENKLYSSQLIPLTIKQEIKDVYLENQLDKMKKHLYMMRRYRKQNIEEERQRLNQLNQRRSNLFFKKDSHTYGFDGVSIEIKKIQRSESLVEELSPNTTTKPNSKGNSMNINSNLKRKSINSTFEKTGDSSQFIVSEKQINSSRKLTSQQLRSFNNGNQRQTSHLPYIRLKQNTKMIENKKQISGSSTLRNSLNRSIISKSSDNSTFKSFAKLQQQKKIQKVRLKVLQLSQGDDFFKTDLLTPTLHKDSLNHDKKQSKMMQKYIKKLCEQRTKVQKLMQDQKSVNFSQIKVPQRYPIQRYYQYNYDTQKSFDNETGRKVLNGERTNERN